MLGQQKQLRSDRSCEGEWERNPENSYATQWGRIAEKHRLKTFSEVKSSPRAAQLSPFYLHQRAWKQFSKTSNKSSPESGLDQGSQTRWQGGKITQTSHIYRKQSICGNREEKTGNTHVGENVERLEVSSIDIGRIPMIQPLWKIGRFCFVFIKLHA